MALITKADMKYTYSWTTVPGDDPRVSGPPDSTRFSRKEGYEVLYLINKLAEAWSLKEKSSGVKMEKMIKDHLPSDVQMQKDVRQWINDNWKKY